MPSQPSSCEIRPSVIAQYLILEPLQLIECVKQPKILPLKAKALDLIFKWRPPLRFFAPEMHEEKDPPPKKKRHGNFVT